MTIIVSTVSDAPKNFGDLKSDVADWLARDDLDDKVSRFVRLAEADICTDLKVRGQEKQQTYSSTTGIETLPTDYLGMRSIYLNAGAGERKLDYLPPERFHTSQAASLSGNPSAFTIEGNTLKLAPVPVLTAPADIRMLYIGAYEPFVNASDANDLLVKHYDLYLYCALSHGFSYLRDDPQAVKYRAKYDESAAKINRNANRERIGPNMIRTGVFSP